MTSYQSSFSMHSGDLSDQYQPLQSNYPLSSTLTSPRSTNWLGELSNLPSDWALLPLNGNKKPIDPASGLLMKGWPSHQGFSIDELQEVMPLAVGVLTGPVSGGLLAVDFDGPGSEERFQHIFNRPSSELPASLSWSSGKPERRQVAFNVDLDWWDLLKGKVVWINTQNKTILELCWKGQQSVIAGAHPETMGYFWLPGCSPADFPEPAMAPDWLLIPLLCESGSVQELPVSSGEDQDRAFAMLAVLPASDFTDYHSWLKVGMALHSVDPGLLNSWVAWSAEMPNFDEAECLRKWESFGGHGTPVTIATLYFLAKKYGYQARSSTRQKQVSTKLKIQQAKEVCAGVGKITWPLPPVSGKLSPLSFVHPGA